MKTITFCVSLFALIFISPLRGQELLTNPGFLDSNGDGVPDGWTPSPAPDNASTFLSMTTYGGSPCVRVVDQSSTKGVGLKQNVAVRPGFIYRQTLSAQGGAIYLYFHWYDVSNNLIEPERLKKATGGSNAYTLTEYTETAPARATSLNVWIYSTTANETTTYLKQMSLNEIGVSFDETAATFNFEKTNWSGALLITNRIMQGRSAGLWSNHSQVTRVGTTAFDHDLSGYESISVQIHSAAATGEKVTLVLDSRYDPNTFSYFYYSFNVNWAGWSNLVIPFRSFGSLRSPVGFQKIDSISFNVGGWGGTADPSSVLTLDQIHLTAGAVAPVPAASQFTSKISASHPRVLLTPTRVAALSTAVATDTNLMPIYNSVLAQANSVLTQAVAPYQIVGGRLLTTSRLVVSRMYLLGFSYLITGDNRYLNRGWTELSNAGAFSNWNPVHYLDTAEMLHGFAIGYDWLFNGLTSGQKSAVRGAMLQKGLSNTLHGYRNDPVSFGTWWEKGENNWNFVCNGGSALAALALATEDPALCGEILSNAFGNVQAALPGFGPDGAWAESVGYWNYSVEYLVPFIQGMKTAMGTNFGLAAAFPAFQKSGDFPVYLSSPMGYADNFGDQGYGKMKAGELFWLSGEAHSPLPAWYQQKNRNNTVEEILYYTNMAVGYTPTQPRDRFFRGDFGEFVTMRSSWTNTNAFFIGVKAGRSDVNHGHLDQGTFVLDAFGTRWFDELGCDDYNLPKYFTTSLKNLTNRYVYYRIRAEGHNTLVIDPNRLEDQDPLGFARVLDFSSASKTASTRLDLSGVYPQSLKTLRTMSLSRNRDYALLDDDIALKSPSTLWWFAHTQAAVVIDASGRKATLSKNGVATGMVAEILSPDGATFSLRPATPLPSSPNPIGQNANANFQKLSIQLTNISQTRIKVAFYPNGTTWPSVE